MLNAGEKMVAYQFSGYWKDVGTIESLWESNMDLLDPNVPLDLSDESWKIYSRNPAMPPHYIASTAKLQNSLISEGCNVYGEVDFSVLFAGVYVAPGAVVKDSIIMPGARIEEGAVVQYCHCGRKLCGEREQQGWRPSGRCRKQRRMGRCGSGAGCVLEPGTVVPPKAMIDAEEVAK